MKNISFFPGFSFLGSMIFQLPLIAQTNVHGKLKEDFKLEVISDRNVINYNKLQQQSVISFSDRVSGTRDAIILPYLISKGVQGIQALIDNQKKKYNSQYNFAQTDLNFYDQLSTQSSFDPTGLQFKGFTIIRSYEGPNGNVDTAFIASFVLDTSNVNEIINSSTFRLKVKGIEIRRPKVKMPKNSNIVNMDFEITFSASYINEGGQMFTDVPLGKFLYSLRNAPIGKNTREDIAFYDSLVGKPLIGKSFIVPRSKGFYYSQDNNLEKAFSLGSYSIQVTVKETSKNNFVDKLIINNGTPFLTIVQQELLKTVAPPTPTKPKSGGHQTSPGDTLIVTPKTY
jgi:hypothetical protein